jgi:hypothetical protein
LLWIDFRAQEIRADLGELRARCSYHDPAPDQAIRDIRIALDELVDRRRALQTAVTTMAFMLFFGCVSATFAEPSLIPNPCAPARQHPRVATAQQLRPRRPLPCWDDLVTCVLGRARTKSVCDTWPLVSSCPRERDLC